MSLQKIITWYTLAGQVVHNRSFTDNFQRQSKLWYFEAKDGEDIIVFNYRKYGNRLVLYKSAYIEKFNHLGGAIGCDYYDTVTELKEAVGL